MNISLIIDESLMIFKKKSENSTFLLDFRRVFVFSFNFLQMLRKKNSSKIFIDIEFIFAEKIGINDLPIVDQMAAI